MRILVLVTAMLVTISGAYAQYSRSVTAGTCPNGTYSKGGATWANDVKNCSSANKPYAERFQNSAKKKH